MNGKQVTDYYNIDACSKNIVLPANAESVSDNALANKGILTVNLNNIIDIGNSALENNKLDSIIIPSSVKTIGNYAFRNNLLSSITVLENTLFTKLGTSWNGNVLKVNFIGNSIENNCYQVTENEITKYQQYCPTTVVIPTTLNGVEINSIGKNAFKNSAVNNITIGSHIDSIGDNAFINNNNLNTIYINGKSSLLEFTSLGVNWNGTCNNIVYNR